VRRAPLGSNVVLRLLSVPSARSRVPGPGRGRRLLLGLAAVVLVVALSGCQAKVAIDAQVNKDGSGTLKVALGLDEKALQRLGDPAVKIQTQDMTAAGWVVAAPVKEADGLTWIRASKSFANAAELTASMEALTAPPAMFSGFAFTRVETDDTITYKVVGTIDPAKGMASFSDADLAGKLNGDPFGGNIAAIEAEEGKPIADMVSMTVSVSVADGPAKSYPVTLRDKAPTAVDVATVEQKPPPLLASIGIYGAIIVGVVLIVVMLVGVRRRHNA
jgi:hypothetical protein